MNGSLRLLLLLAVLPAAALAVHERRGRSGQAAIAAAAAAAAGGLAISLLSGGAVVERGFDGILPGAGLTLRGDRVGMAVLVTSLVLWAVAVLTARPTGDRLSGTLLCLWGTAAVACGGTLVVMSGGVVVVAAGIVIVHGRRGGGWRMARLLGAGAAGAGLLLSGAAAALLAVSGTSDLSFVPAGAVAGVPAILWALAGATLLVLPTVLGASGDRPWAAIAAVPCGYLVLARLAVSAGGSVPTPAAVSLSAAGAALVAISAVTALRAPGPVAAGRAIAGTLTGILIAALAGLTSHQAPAAAALFVALELILLALGAPDRAGPWGGLAGALAVLPGGAGFAAALLALGGVAGQGAWALPQLLVLTGGTMAAAVAGARHLPTTLVGWRRPSPGALVGVAGGLAGGLLAGAAAQLAAGWLAPAPGAVGIEAAVVTAPGVFWPSGYLLLGGLVVVGLAMAAVEVAGGAPPLPAPVAPAALPAPLALGRLLALRRRLDLPLRRAAAVLATVDQWMDQQPTLALVAVAAAVALLVMR